IDLPAAAGPDTRSPSGDQRDPTGGDSTGVADGAIPVDPAAEAVEFTRVAEATEVGRRSLEHLDRVIAGMAAAFAYTPPAHLIPRARLYRRQVARFIAGRHTLRELRQLYRDAGWLSIILAWLSHD